jgi:predicted Zn-ribbon and HTH transcriptional regulator
VFIIGVLLMLIYCKVVVLGMGEITLKGYVCERCEHTWVPREDERPRVCPKCKSPYWDVPRGQVKHLGKRERPRLR